MKTRALCFDVYVSAELGERARIDRSIAGMAEFGTSASASLVNGSSLHSGAMLAILDGNFSTAGALASKAHETRAAEHGNQVEGVYGIQMFTIRREQGRLSEVAPVVKRLIAENPDETAWLPGFALIAADLGFEERLGADCAGWPRPGSRCRLTASEVPRCPTLRKSRPARGNSERGAIYELMLAYKRHDHHGRYRNRLLWRGEPLSRHVVGDARRV